VSDDSIGRHFDRVAPDYDRWKEKAHYYYDALKASVAEVVPPGSRVLEVGCGTGDVLAFLRPAEGLGVDISPAMVELAARKHPELRFRVQNLMEDPPGDWHDYVVAVDVVEHVPDLDRCLATMAAMLDPGGRLVVITANPVWGPILEATERLGLKMPEGEHTWRSRAAIQRAAQRSGLREVSFTRSFVVPKNIPGLRLLNRAPWAAGLRQRFGIIQRAVFERPAAPPG
jgi:ubiquinone/menaquinone biosynthesis C-methylase UbiE